MYAVLRNREREKKHVSIQKSILCNQAQNINAFKLNENTIVNTNTYLSDYLLSTQ